MSHRPTCSWDGSHQRGEGKVELALLRPLMDALVAEQGRAALERALEGTGLRAGEGTLYQIWLERGEADTLLERLLGLQGGVAALQGWRCLRLSPAVAGLGPGGGKIGLVAQRSLQRFAWAFPGLSSRYRLRGWGGLTVELGTPGPGAAPWGPYLAALLLAALKEGAALPLGARVTPAPALGGGAHRIEVPFSIGVNRGRPLMIAALGIVGAWAFRAPGGPGWGELLLGTSLGALLGAAWRAEAERLRRLREAQQARVQAGQIKHLLAMQRFQSALAAKGGDCIAIFSPSGRLEFANQRMAQLHGISAAGARRLGLEQALAPLWRAAQAARHQGPTEYRAGPGEALGLLVEESRDADGGAGVLLRLRQSSEEERRRAEAATRDALLSALIRHGEEALLVVSQDGVILQATPNTLRLFGIRPEQLLGQGLGSLVEEDGDGLLSMLRQLGPGGGFTLRVPIRDGRRESRWAQIAVEDRRDVPEIGAFLVQVRDVTPLMEFEAAVHETEDSLRKSEAYYRMIIEGSSDLVLLLGADLKVVFANQALTPLLGYTPASVLGRSVLEFVPVEEHPAAHAALALVKAQRSASARLHGLHADGSRRLFEAHARYETDPDGRPVYVVAARDITREDALEKRAAQEGRLEAIGRLAGGVAHDFNNLLTVIQGNAELAMAASGTGSRPHLKEITDASVRAGQLVQQLLSFGRKQVMQVTPLDLGALLREHEGFVRRVLGSGIRLKVEVQPGEHRVRAEPMTLSRALLNLAANAKDAMPGGGVFTLRLGRREVGPDEAALHPDRAPGDYAVLEAIDTGEGMDAAVQARIFEPYFTTRGKGNGLGLSMVFGMVRQLGGFIHVHSRLGEGSEFAIHLPITAAVEAAPAEAEAPVGRSGAVGQGRQVLVVDDEASVLRLAAQGLRSAGFEVLEAADGEEALATWREARHNHVKIDLVLSDVVMPRMNGIQLREHMQSMDPSQRCLLMSGYYDPQEFDADAKVVGLVKPFSVQKLIETVDHCIRSAD